jgi:hypothetical protein
MLAKSIVDVTFEEVNPGPGKDYMYHPTPGACAPAAQGRGSD